MLDTVITVVETIIMIDSDIRFGAPVPKVPQFYKDMANKPMKKEEPTTGTAAAITTKTNDDCCAIGDEWTALKLVKCEPYNHDTSLFTFLLPPFTKTLRLPLMGHLLIRKNTADDNNSTTKAVRPYTAVYEDEDAGTFTLLIKRYQEWGVPEEKLKSQGRVFLYCKTNHSYKPPGIVSNHIHSLQPGKDTLEFLYSDTHNRGHSLPPQTRNLTLIAVGVGIAPMIRLLRHILPPNNDDNNNSTQLQSIRLLYGVRTVADILLRPQLEEWNTQYNDKFRAIVCVGSRWSNVHFAAKKTKEHQPPPLPKGYASIHLLEKELGWINADKISKHAASTPNDDKHIIMVCGLPSVYDNLCGPRKDHTLSPTSQLYKLGYRDHQVMKF